jgi:hypothetical protein
LLQTAYITTERDSYNTSQPNHHLPSRPRYNRFKHSRPARTRREFIEQAFCGFGSLALASLMSAQAARGANPLAAKPPHQPEAKAVIFLFMTERALAIEFLSQQPLGEFALAMFNLNGFLYVE